jgi:hypothetical protein
LSWKSSREVSDLGLDFVRALETDSTVEVDDVSLNDLKAERGSEERSRGELTLTVSE